jgi:hypothetical protein
MALIDGPSSSSSSSSRSRRSRSPPRREVIRSRTPPRRAAIRSRSPQRREAPREPLRRRSRSSSRGRNNGPVKREICRDFDRGECARGAGCRFEHNVKEGNERKRSRSPGAREPPSRPRSSSRGRDSGPARGAEICRDFGRGECTRGVGCRFSHGTKEAKGRSRSRSPPRTQDRERSRRSRSRDRR